MVKGWGLLRTQVQLTTRNGTVTWIRPLSLITRGACSVSQFLDALFSHMGRNRATPGRNSTPNRGVADLAVTSGPAGRPSACARMPIGRNFII